MFKAHVSKATDVLIINIGVRNQCDLTADVQLSVFVIYWLITTPLKHYERLLWFDSLVF